MGIPVSTLRQSTSGTEARYVVERSPSNENDEIITKSANSLDGIANQQLEQHVLTTARNSLKSQQALKTLIPASNNKSLEVFVPKVDNNNEDDEMNTTESASYGSGTKLNETKETDDFDGIIDEQKFLTSESSTNVPSTRSLREKTFAEDMQPAQEDGNGVRISRYLATYIEADYIVHNLTTDFSRYLNDDVSTVFVENPAYLQNNDRGVMYYYSRNRMPFFCRYSHNYHC